MAKSTISKYLFCVEPQYLKAETVLNQINSDKFDAKV